MKKGWISIVSGLTVGLVISYFTLEYSGWNIVHHNQNGEVEQNINELDFNFITNSFLIVIVSIIIVYLLISLIDKKKQRY